MSGGSEFHVAGPACEKTRSLNLVSSRGVTYLLLEADRRPVRVAALLDVRTMSLRYAGHLPVCIPYMIMHSLKSIRQRFAAVHRYLPSFILLAITVGHNKTHQNVFCHNFHKTRRILNKFGRLLLK